MQTQEQVKANTAEREKTCKERVRRSFNSRFSDIMQLWQADCEGKEEGVEGLGTLNEYGLSFDYVAPDTYTDQKIGYFRYQISWGGPSEEFRIWTNPDFSPYKVQFWFLDWGDGAKVTLTGKKFKQFSEFFVYTWVDTESAKYALDKATKDLE